MGTLCLEPAKGLARRYGLAIACTGMQGRTDPVYPRTAFASVTAWLASGA